MQFQKSLFGTKSTFIACRVLLCAVLPQSFHGADETISCHSQAPVIESFPPDNGSQSGFLLVIRELLGATLVSLGALLGAVLVALREVSWLGLLLLIWDLWVVGANVNSCILGCYFGLL